MQLQPRNYIGIVFLALILAFIAWLMKDSGTALEGVMPSAFLAFVSIATAGVASFLFDLAESKLSLPEWMGHGRLSVIGGAAVFIATLIILLYFQRPTPSGPGATPAPDMSVESRIYLSTWQDPRISEPDMELSQLEEALTSVWQSKIMLEAAVTYRDKSIDQRGYDVHSFTALLSFPKSEFLESILFRWNCTGHRDDGIIKNIGEDWHECKASGSRFSVGKEMVRHDVILESIKSNWHTLQERIVAYKGEFLQLTFIIAGDFPNKDFQSFKQTYTCQISHPNMLKLFQPTEEGLIPTVAGIPADLTNCKQV